MGADRGVNCEHMHVLVTNILQKHWEWKEDRRDAVLGVGRQITAFMASLDVRTFEVAKPGVGTRGHVVAALLEEMKDIRGSACFKNCVAEFRYSGCIRQGSVEALVLWRKIAKCVLWRGEEKWKARRWGLWFGGEDDDQHRFGCMMWADNCRIFSHDRVVLTVMIKDLIGEVMGLDMEPKPESLWWKSTF